MAILSAAAVSIRCKQPRPCRPRNDRNPLEEVNLTQSSLAAAEGLRMVNTVGVAVSRGLTVPQQGQIVRRKSPSPSGTSCPVPKLRHQQKWKLRSNARYSSGRATAV